MSPIVKEMESQINEWRKQQDMIEDMIEEMYMRIDSEKGTSQRR